MQSIIVYRNPAEAAFWDLVTSGQIFPILAGIAVFFIAMVGLASLVEKYVPWKYRNIVGNTAIVVSGVIGVLVFRILWSMF